MIRRFVGALIGVLLVMVLTGCGNKVSSHSTLTCYSNSSSMQTKTSYAVVSH